MKDITALREKYRILAYKLLNPIRYSEKDADDFVELILKDREDVLKEISAAVKDMEWECSTHGKEFLKATECKECGEVEIGINASLYEVQNYLKSLTPKPLTDK